MSIRLVLLATGVGASVAMSGPSVVAQSGGASRPASTVGPWTGTRSSGQPDSAGDGAGHFRSTMPIGSRAVKKGATSFPSGGEHSAASDDKSADRADQGQSWTAAELAEAKAHCDAVLAGVEAVTEQETPIREGACGSPALVKLVSIGRSPAVQLSPPAVVSCDMVASLHKWFKADVQRLARAHLGGSIVKIEVMSSYSCRNAYGRSRTNLSEHGRANALDIGGFVTASTRYDPSA